MKKIQIAENDIIRMAYKAAKRTLKEWRYRWGSNTAKGYIIIDLEEVFSNISKPFTRMNPGEMKNAIKDFDNGQYIPPMEYTDEIFEWFNTHKKVNNFDDAYYYIDATFRYDAPDPEVGWRGIGWEPEEYEGVDDLVRMINEYPEFTGVQKRRLIQGVNKAYEKAIKDGDWDIEEDDSYDLDMRDYYEDR